LIEYQVVLALALPLLLTPAEGWKQLKRSPITYLNRRRWMAPIGFSHYYVFNSITLGWGMKRRNEKAVLLHDVRSTVKHPKFEIRT
jgi:hypothetical protein